jgi:NAD(P)H-dependent flavin oxidoreductase YrpB (nitropropane dioxygenase family)
MGELGLKVPIMQAPVGSAATARLASDVCRVGGLGALGASWTKPEVLRERIRTIQRVTDRPFACIWCSTSSRTSG